MMHMEKEGNKELEMNISSFLMIYREVGMFSKKQQKLISVIC